MGKATFFSNLFIDIISNVRNGAMFVNDCLFYLLFSCIDSKQWLQSIMNSYFFGLYFKIPLISCNMLYSFNCMW